MEIRKTEEADVPAVVALIHKTLDADKLYDPRAIPFIKDKVTAQRIARELSHAFSLVVIDDFQQIVGFGGANNNKITHLFVDPDYQGRGIGQQLFEQLIEHVSTVRSGIKNFVIRQNSSPTALPIYLKNGFKEVERQTLRMNGIPVQRIVVEKKINADPS